RQGQGRAQANARAEAPFAAPRDEESCRGSKPRIRTAGCNRNATLRGKSDAVRRRDSGDPGAAGRDPWIPACAGKGICLDLRHITPKAEITPSDLEQAVKKSAAAIPQR